MTQNRSYRVEQDEGLPLKTEFLFTGYVVRQGRD